jgi:hypothetical protein
MRLRDKAAEALSTIGQRNRSGLRTIGGNDPPNWSSLKPKRWRFTALIEG